MPSLATRMVVPAHAREPVKVRTYGPEVAQLCALAGFAPDEEQQLGLDMIFGVGEHGGPSCPQFCILCSRQNQKTGLLKQAALGWLFITDERLVMWTAHEFSTTKESFAEMVELITSSPLLSKRLAPGVTHGIFQGSADVRIALASGAEARFKARTQNGARGLGAPKLILDEGFALTSAHMGALMPLMSAQRDAHGAPSGQMLIASSAGRPTSDVLRGFRDRGRSGVGDGLGYLEWCAPEGSCADPECEHRYGIAEGCALDRRDYWQMANPAMGRRISEGCHRCRA